jgi:hypothetical protein
MSVNEDLKNSIIELYQNVKIRKQSDTKRIDQEFLDQEKLSLQTVSSISLIDYIKVHLNLLINLKVSDKLSKLKSNPMEFITLYGSDIPANDYEKLLRRYEADIRNYIKLVNVLKINIEELNQKQEILENQIEQMQKESMNLIPTTQSIEYRKKIEELTALVKTYEKRDLKIPLLEEKIKKQKIELNQLDLYYKKQIKNYTKKIEIYEKGIYLNNNCYINKKTKIYKPKHKLNSISPKRKTTNMIKHNKYSQLKTIEDETIFNDMKRTKSINNIFFKLKNQEIQTKINSNITSNLNLNGGNLNANNQNIPQKSENIKSPKFIDNNIHNYYDSIETDSIENKTINIAGTASNFRKKLNLKSNYRYNTNKEREKKIEKDNIRKASTKINTKKVMKRINSNRTSLKIPKNIPNNINTSKYIHTKEKKIPKFTRYNSLKYLNNGKSRKNNTSINSIKENEVFNKTFSRVDCINNNNNIIVTTRYNNYNSNQSQRNSVKNFILNKITKVTISNGKTPVPIKRTQSKTRSIIK